MSILIYWKYDNYLKDIAEGVNYNFNSNQSRLHTASEIGGDIFAVTGIKRKLGLEIYLAAHLIVKDKVYNPPDFIYGKYRIEADEEKSRYFSINGEPITPYLSELESIKHYDNDQSYKYAQSFQTLRKLSESDAETLKKIADKLPLK